ncbi:MAG TPA: hypothetical protein VK179_07775 [Bacteroidales bacterium]|nr:hypothetical protein [Bacteroidales bacterium]
MTEKNQFLKLAESLKLVRKTRIEDFVEDKTIDDIYTDLLPKDGILNKLNLPRTTILVGRKGTGKSTIFQKSQKDLISNKKCISIYIDVRTLYENSSPDLPEGADGISSELQKYLLYSNLIKEIILETKMRLNDFIGSTVLNRILGFDNEQLQRITIELNEIENSIKDVIKKVDGSLVTTFKQTNEDSRGKTLQGGFSLSESPKLDVSSEKKNNHSVKTEFESSLINYLDIKKCLIDNLMRIKTILEINHLYIFLDDYSEIDENAQKIFMDYFIAPLNNNSEDFVKFKIAVYPHRFYYGKLDNSKIDEISLEFFDAFYTFEKEVDISKMETLALDYTKRLLKRRLNIFFPDNNWESFFTMNETELFSLLFSVSFNNPRKIGFILSYCYESCLIHDAKISREAIENAAQRYYSDVTLKYFLANHFVTKPFDDKISNEHQFELLNKIVEKQKINASSLNRSKIKGKPTNHFTVNKDISNLLDNLELNGFITTYNNVYDKNSRLSIIFSFDYGLCKRHGLNFQRAYNEKLLTYFSHPRFNMNILITEYFNKTQVIKCPKGHEFPYSMLDTLKKFKMRCPECIEEGIFDIRCEISISSEEIRAKLKLIEDSNLKEITLYEFQVLDYLKTIDKVVSITKISKAFDKSFITSKTTVDKLHEKGLIKQDFEASRQLQKDLYSLSDKGDKFITRILMLMENIIKNNSQ